MHRCVLGKGKKKRAAIPWQVGGEMIHNGEAHHVRQVRMGTAVLAPSWRRLGHAGVGVLDVLELRLPRRLGTIASVTAAGRPVSWAEYVSAAAASVWLGRL